MRQGRGTGVPPVQGHGQDGHATSHSIQVRQGAYLPHWTREGAIYAVTFRLADSLPQLVLESWKFERQDIIKTAQQMNRPLSDAETARLDKLFSEKVEQYLDAGAGECWMQRREDVAQVVSGALQHFDGARYELFAWCVMPNHVHAVLQPFPGYELSKIVHSWKSFTSKEANRLIGRTGQFWQPEPYDHLVRDEKDFWCQVEYVLTNPARAGLENWKWVGRGRGVPPVQAHGQDGHATRGGRGVPPVQEHGQDGHATRGGTGVPPVQGHGQDGHATAHATTDSRKGAT